MRFVCENCRRRYEIKDEKVAPKGVNVKCRNCGHINHVKKADAKANGAAAAKAADSSLTQMIDVPVGMSSPDLTAVQPAKKSDPKESFLGADEDEIGAVFDQVLKHGPDAAKAAAAPAPADFPMYGAEDDEQSTRVLQADVVRQLVAAAEGNGATAPASALKNEDVPATDWYVAIGDKQTGPVTLEKVKSLWDQGELGPDSLCWRNGFADWLPLSTVKSLASVLAPKPAKPIVVAAVPTHSVVSVPVQSAFSSGGMVHTVQSELQVPVSAALGSVGREEAGGWKPSAANALASLVKDEMAALSKPQSAPPVAALDVSHSKGLLDVPAEVADSPVIESPKARRSTTSVAMANPYVASTGATYSAAPVTSYRPPPNRSLWLMIAAVGAIVVALIAVVIWLATKTPQIVVAPAPAPAPVAAAPAAAPPAAAAPASGSPVVPAVAPAVVAAAVPAAPVPPVEPARRPIPVVRPSTGGTPRVAAAKKPDEAPAAAPEKKEAPVDSDDEFAKAFGGGGSKKTDTGPKEGSAAPTKPKSVYIPPAPGSGGDLKETLSQTDMMEVVRSNMGPLRTCKEEQNKKDPNLKGTVKMKWSVTTAGKATQISCVDDDFKQSYFVSCITGVIKTWTFPRSKTQADPFTFPFKI
jgi:predicted Zn finger-like uncharacterized protein